jgi:hypothetical protein
MTDHCRNCKYKIHHPHHDGLGVYSNECSPHHRKLVGNTLKCAHHEKTTLTASDIAVPCLIGVGVKAGMNRKLKVIDMAFGAEQRQPASHAQQ